MQHYETFLIGSLVKRADLENRLSPGLAAFSGLLPFGPMAHGWFGSNRFGQGLREQGRSLLEGIGGAAAGNLAGHGIGGLLQKIPATKLDLQPILQRYPHLARFGPQAESALSKVYLNLPKIRSAKWGALLALLGGAAGSMHGAARSAENFNQRHPVSNWLHGKMASSIFDRFRHADQNTDISGWDIGATGAGGLGGAFWGKRRSQSEIKRLGKEAVRQGTTWLDAKSQRFILENDLKNIPKWKEMVRSHAAVTRLPINPKDPVAVSNWAFLMRQKHRLIDELRRLNAKTKGVTMSGMDSLVNAAKLESNKASELFRLAKARAPWQIAGLAGLGALAAGTGSHLLTRNNQFHKGAGALGKFIARGYPQKRQAVSAVEKYFSQRSLPALSGVPIEWTKSDGLLGVPYSEVINALRRAMRRHQPMMPYRMPRNTPLPLP